MNVVKTSEPKGDVRSAAAAYGFCLGLVMWLLVFFVPFPYGVVIVCLGLCLQMTAFAVVVWRRTRLPLMTAALLSVVVGCGIQMYVLLHARAAGIGRLPSEPADLIDFWPMGAAVVIAPLCMLAEWRWHRDPWNAWKAAMQHATITDVLLFRHVPNLREGASAVDPNRSAT